VSFGRGSALCLFAFPSVARTSGFSGFDHILETCLEGLVGWFMPQEVLAKLVKSVQIKESA